MRLTLVGRIACLSRADRANDPGEAAAQAPGVGAGSSAFPAGAANAFGTPVPANTRPTAKAIQSRPMPFRRMSTRCDLVLDETRAQARS